MMTNLFSTFDPSTSMNLSMNWLSVIMFTMMMPYMMWTTPSRYNKMMYNLMNMLFNELKMMMNNKKMLILFISLFMLIMMENMMGLMPYIFTSTSHLVFSMSMSVPLWMTMMMYGWTKKSQHMLSHLIPTGTPPLLMPFMVMIETISNMIRPGSLAVRLTANMIAGHLLMSLLGNNMNESDNWMMPLILTIQMIMMMFETAVSMIQAYVFSVLSTLYTSEVN
nr:ATP synthase F0 subunit 6 [Hypselosoma matsumurae]